MKNTKALLLEDFMIYGRCISLITSDGILTRVDPFTDIDISEGYEEVEITDLNNYLDSFIDE